MRVDAFDFHLPPERIALTPASPRDSARMLVVGADGRLTDSHVRDLPDFLTPGDALVVNDTRVIAARLEGVRVRGDAVASIEATLIERVDDCRWRALARPAKRLKVGERIRFGESSESMACLLAALDAEVEEKGEAGEALLRFELRRRGAGRSDRAIGRPPFAALHRLSPSRNRERSHGLSDDVRGQTGRGGGADRGAAFHAGPGCSPRRARRRAPSRHPACWRWDFHGRQSRGYARPQDAVRMGLDRRGDRPGAERLAGSRGPDRLRRHDVGAHPRERR